MIIPPYLVPGDTVALAAPARKISEQEILPAENWLKSEGFNVFYDDRLFAEEHQFAGSDQVRADYFQSLLDNDDVKLIWCVRGGYGSARIIDRLDFPSVDQHAGTGCRHDVSGRYRSSISECYGKNFQELQTSST